MNADHVGISGAAGKQLHVHVGERACVLAIDAPASPERPTTTMFITLRRDQLNDLVAVLREFLQ